MVKAALFDLDGTLIDTEGQYSIIWARIGQTFCPEIDHLQERIKGTTLKQILSRYFPDPETQIHVMQMIDDFEATMDYCFFPGALDFISDLHRHGVKCAVVTSSDQKKMQHLREQVKDFDSLFDAVLTAEDFAASKPNPDCYLRAADRLGFCKEECAVFEDAFSGLEAGMNAGIFTFGIASYNTPDQIQDKCDHVLPNFVGFNYEQMQAIHQTGRRQA